jgi:hypothetical protein
VFSEGAQEYHFSPFIKKSVERRFFTKSKYLLHQTRVIECDGQCIEVSPFYGGGDNSNNEEMANNKCVGDTSLDASEFHSRLMADAATRIKLKAREVFTVPFWFLCDYPDQSENHMSFITTKGGFSKEKLHHFMKKINKCQSIQTGRNFLALQCPTQKIQKLGEGGKSQAWMMKQLKKNLLLSQLQL